MYIEKYLVHSKSVPYIIVISARAKTYEDTIV